MRLRATKRFYDTGTGQHLRPGDEFEATQARGRDLVRNGHAEAVETTAAPERRETKTDAPAETKTDTRRRR